MPPDRLAELAGLVLAAMLASTLSVHGAAAAHRAIMPVAFVVVFAALMLLGAPVAVFVGAAAALTPAFVMRRSSRLLSLSDSAIVLPAVLAADLAHRSIAGALPSFQVWPWLAVPIVAAILSYHVTQGVLGDVVVPMIARRGFDRSWPARALEGFPLYLIGGGVATVLVAVIDRRMWNVAPVVGALMWLGYRMYADYVHRLAEAHRRGEVIDYIDQGMAVLDRDGRVTLWNDALEHILRCSRNDVLGRPLVDALPPLGRSELPRAIAETAQDGRPRTLNHLRLQIGPDVRIVQVKVLPVSGGVALLWHDVTERARAEHELRSTGERLALAAEGANDGLWQWNLQTQEFYVSGRWRAMIGLPAQAAIGGPNEWLDRVHAEDIGSLKANLDAHLAGTTPVFQHEHRIRHEDGSYRRVLSRGVAVRAAGRKPNRIAGSLTDTTEQAIAQERLRSVGFLDSLTGLCNRTVFVEGIGRRFDECRRRGVSNGFAVLYLDLDRFKIVNDSLGHMVGDELLIAASRRLETCLRQGDTLARLGGDEFADLPDRPQRRRSGQRHRGPNPAGAERPVHDRRPRRLHVGEHRHRLRSRTLRQPRRDHARRRHGDVSRQVTG